MTPANYGTYVDGPAVDGIIVELGWSSIQSTPNGPFEYNWAGMHSWYTAAEANGHRIIYKIMDRDFKASDGFVPAFLGADKGVNSSCATCETAHRWSQIPVWSKYSLHQAMAAEFHTETNGVSDYPLIEGIAYQETSLGLGWYQPNAGNYLNDNGYTPQLYVDQMIATLANARQNLPNWQIFQYANSISGMGGTSRIPYLEQIAAGAEMHGIVYGHPDILPERAELPEGVYPVHRTFKGRVGLFTAAQYDSQKADEPAHVNNSTAGAYSAYFPNGSSAVWQPDELIVYAEERLHVDYFFWNYDVGGSATPGGRWHTKPTAFDAMEANPIESNYCE